MIFYMDVFLLTSIFYNEKYTNCGRYQHGYFKIVRVWQKFNPMSINKEIVEKISIILKKWEI